MKIATQWPPICQRYAVTASVQKAGQSLSSFTSYILLPHGPGKPGAQCGCDSADLMSRSGRSRNLPPLPERVRRNENMTTTSIRKESQLCTEPERRVGLPTSAEIGTGEGIRRFLFPHKGSSAPGLDTPVHTAIRRAECIVLDMGSPAHEEHLRGDAG